MNEPNDASPLPDAGGRGTSRHRPAAALRLTPRPSPPLACEARVLVVDDREASRLVTARVLRGAGYEVIEADSGEAALAALSPTLSLVVLDLRLPDMDGREVCRTIRRHPTASRVPVLHLSAYAATSSVRADGLDHGADAFLTQPVAADELLATVAALVRTHRAEAEVRRREREWAATFDAIRDAVGLLAPDGRLLRCNHAMATLLGVARDQAAGRRFARLLGDAMGAADGDALLTLIAGVEDGVAEARLDARWLSVRVSRVADEQDGEVGRLVVLSDVTADRRATETQRVLADVTHALSTAPDLASGLAAVPTLVAGRLADWCGAFVLDGRGVRAVGTHGPLALPDEAHAIGASDGGGPGMPAGGLGAIVARHLLGRAAPMAGATTRLPAPGEPLVEVLPVADGVSWLAASLAASDTASDTASDAVGDVRRALLVLATRARGHAFDTLDAGLAHDLLHRMRLAAERSRLVAASEGARREAVRLQAAAERASLAKSEFVAAMSHEIRTPLNAIVGYTELLALELAGPLTETQADHVARIQSAGRHLNGIVSDVLDLAKIEGGHLEMDVTTADAHDVVRDALVLARPQAAAAGLTLSHGAAPTEPAAYQGDPARVRQILLNLLSNAIKFTGTGGSIRVVVARRAAAAPTHSRLPCGPWVTVGVADTGRGIPPAHQALVFDPFVQVGGAGARREGRDAGAGLGLAISRRLARLMRGDLVVESLPGRGSTFTLWLPAGPPDPVQGACGTEGGPDASPH